MLDDFDSPAEYPDKWSILVRNVLYMLFLMLESGRRSISTLVENRAVCAQFAVEILLSELICYGMLLRTYEEAARKGFDYDARWKRLKLRVPNYQIMIPNLCSEIVRRNGSGDNAWRKVGALVPELERVWREATSQSALTELGDSQ